LTLAPGARGTKRRAKRLPVRARQPSISRETVALVGAGVLHLLAWWASRSQSAEPQSASQSARFEPDAIEIGFETASRDEIAQPRAARAQGGASRPSARSAPAPVELPSEAVAELGDDRPLQEETAESAPRIDPQSNTPIDLGIGENGWQRWVTGPNAAFAVPSDDAGRSARRALVRAPSASKTGGLQEGLEARTRAVGLGPSGRVASALRGAAHRKDAPELGKARFQITVTRDGAVEVSVATATEPKDAWEAVARHAAADLRRKPPRIPAGRAGARLVVELVADERFPNGVGSKSLRAPHLEAAAPRLRSVEEGRKEIEDLNSTAANDSVPLQEQIANTEVPGVFIAGQNKVCKYRAGVTPLGTLQAPSGNRDRDPGAEFRIQGACDPSNLDAKAARVVRVAVVDEQMF
jgi:hypothetical protein